MPPWGLDALLMSLAAVPAYLLARPSWDFGGRSGRPADGRVPSMAYTGTLMTENAFYRCSCVA